MCFSVLKYRNDLLKRKEMEVWEKAEEGNAVCWLLGAGCWLLTTHLSSLVFATDARIKDGYLLHPRHPATSNKVFILILY